MTDQVSEFLSRVGTEVAEAHCPICGINFHDSTQNDLAIDELRCQVEVDNQTCGRLVWEHQFNSMIDDQITNLEENDLFPLWESHPDSEFVPFNEDDDMVVIEVELE